MSILLERLGPKPPKRKAGGGPEVSQAREAEASAVFAAARDISATDPGLAGLGLGTVVLQEGTAWLAANAPAVDRIHAVILPENVASIRSFVAAGYKSLGTGLGWSLALRET